MISMLPWIRVQGGGSDSIRLFFLLLAIGLTYNFIMSRNRKRDKLLLNGLESEKVKENSRFKIMASLFILAIEPFKFGKNKN